MPRPISRWRTSWGRRESTCAASDADPSQEPTTGTGPGGPLATPGRHRRVLRARLPLRLLDGPYPPVETAPRPERWRTRPRLARGSHRLGPGHGGGRSPAADVGEPADTEPGAGRLLRLGPVPPAHRFVGYVLRRLSALGLLPGDARRADEHTGDHCRAVLGPRADAGFPRIVEYWCPGRRGHRSGGGGARCFRERANARPGGT